MKILTTNMLLKKLIKNLPIKEQKIQIKGLAINSQKVKKSFIFFAIRGNRNNGEKYIDNAIRNGAVVIVCSKKCKYFNKNIAVIKSSDVRHLVSDIASKFYRFKPKNIIAVTGTNGKTSVANLFYQILNINKISVGIIGTLGIKYKKKNIKSNLTSPDTILLHQALEKMKKNKVENVIVEASSHGLDQKRISHLNLKAAIFTNFSQDHLDYHKSMKSYLNTKLLLFKKILNKNKSVISDKSIKEFPILKRISKKRNLKLLDISQIQNKLEKKRDLRFNQFQLKNISMAVAAAKLCNLSQSKIFDSLHKVKDIDGRMENVKTYSNNIKVFVDFAHTPDALLKTIKELKKFYNQNISLVFGCGGNRDYKKRPLMAKIANNHCRKIYVTDDNPRNEDPSKIRKEIINNISNSNCYNIGNRATAIKFAVKNAEPNEIILIAGKGHEKEQIYKNKTISISDKQIVKKLKFSPKKVSKRNQIFLQNKKILETITNISKVKNFDGLAIDSREVKNDNLFLTIKGKINDGANFIPEALKRGAKYIISSKNLKKYKNKTIKVKNEIKFLNKFANLKRESSLAKIIAITGSAGKTSLKNLIKNLLQNFGDSYSSPRSFNNHYGVPLSLSNLNINHKFGVFEVGMS